MAVVSWSGSPPEGLSEIERLILLLDLLGRFGKPKQPRLRMTRELPTAGRETASEMSDVRCAA